MKHNIRHNTYTWLQYQTDKKENNNIRKWSNLHLSGLDPDCSCASAFSDIVDILLSCSNSMWCKTAQGTLYGP